MYFIKVEKLHLHDDARMKKKYWVHIYIRDFQRNRRACTRVKIYIKLFIKSNYNGFREGPTEDWRKHFSIYDTSGFLWVRLEEETLERI